MNFIPKNTALNDCEQSTFYLFGVHLFLGRKKMWKKKNFSRHFKPSITSLIL